MHVHFVTTALQLIAYLQDVEDTPGAIEVCRIACDELVPGPFLNSPRERSVEQERSDRRYRKTPHFQWRHAGSEAVHIDALATVTDCDDAGPFVKAWLGEIRLLADWFCSLSGVL